MDRVRAASGRQKPRAPTTRLMRTYCRIVAFYPTQLGPRSTRERVEVFEEPTPRREARGRRQGGAERILDGLRP
jgi:hypothetical protein